MAVATQSPATNARANEFLSSPRKMLINGDWVNAASGKTFPVYNPATGDVTAQVAEGEKEDIARAPGLMEACQILFGEDARAKYEEYFARYGAGAELYRATRRN